MKNLFCVIFFNLVLITLSQAQTGMITGLVLDSKNSEPLIGATIAIENTTKGTITDFDGTYKLEDIKPGTYNIVCSYISYQSQKVTDVKIEAGKEVVLDFDLEEAITEMDEVKVVAIRNRESENLLMMEQKEAAVISESIGARELSTKGVSDAASAATKITGITKQEGTKTLNIRGLGDRYNTTLLNGLPLPSNNAETKNIDLELFTTDIIEFVGVDKVFTTNMYGDFAGAVVNIHSKRYIGVPFLQVGVKSGMNSSNSNTSQFYLQDGPGFWGFDDFGMTSSLEKYDFETSWNPIEKTVAPNLGFSMSGGKQFKLFGSNLNSYFTLSYENNYFYSDLLQKRVNGSNKIRKDLLGEQYTYETQTTGMLNLNLDRSKSQYYYNLMLLNTSEQTLKNLRGFIQDLAEDSALIRRSDYERTTALVNQLLGEHTINDKTKFNWGISYNNVLNLIPDRRHLSMNNLAGDTARFTDDNESDNYRYFHDFDENEVAANLAFEREFGKGYDNIDYTSKLTLGYTGKYKQRAFESTQFNHDIYRWRNIFELGSDYFVFVDVLDIDAYLNDANIGTSVDNTNREADKFYLKTFFGNSIRPSSYDGTQIINAGFLQYEYIISPKLLALAGIRVENVFQEVKYISSLAPEGGEGDFNELKFLPSLSFRYSLNEKQNLRFAFGKTYTLPKFTEMALFLFEGITETTLGNPSTYPSTIYNVDLKWEMFPNLGELFSVAAFGKYILDPINKFIMASASNDFTFANTGDWAYLYGIEAEVKKDIYKISTENGAKRLFFSANMSLMKTLQELNADKIREESFDPETNYVINVNFNTKEDELQGAAPLIANANLGYKVDWKAGENSLLGSLVYNYVSDRINLIGTSTFGNQIDKAVHTLDFVLKSTFNKVGASITVRNILDPDIERVQENSTQDFLVKSYKEGVKISFGLSYKF